MQTTTTVPAEESKQRTVDTNQRELTKDYLLEEPVQFVQDYYLQKT